MQISLNQLTVHPDVSAVSELYKAWDWLIDDTYHPILFSVFGDPFFKKGEQVYWLDTGNGELHLVANDEDEFKKKILGEEGPKWLLAPIADKLAQKGIVPKDGQCYSYETLPILGGSYTEENFYLLSIREHFGVTGSMHEQLKFLPDGAKVQIKTTD